MYARGEKVLVLKDTQETDEPVWGTITYVQPDGYLQLEMPPKTHPTDPVTMTVAPENVAAISEVVVSVTFLRELRHTLQRAGLRQ